MQRKIEIELSENSMDVKNFNGLLAAQMTITRDLQRNFIGSKSAEETKAYAKSELKKRINFSGDGSAETKEKALDFLTLDVVSKALGNKGLYAEGGETDEDLLEFTIPDWAVSSLINGDDSGLEDEDIEKIDKFVKRIVEKYGNANFMLPDEDKMDLGFEPFNDIDRLGNDCSMLYLRPSKPYAHGGTTDETIYIYDDEEYSADELIKLADEMAYYENEDYNEGVVVDNLYSAIAFLGEDEVKIKGDVVEGEGKLVYDRDKYNKLLSKYDSIGAMLEDATSESEKMAYKKQLEKLESMLHRYERGYADGGETDEYAKGGVVSKKKMLDYLNMYFDYYDELRTIAVEEDNILTRKMLPNLTDEQIEMAYDDAKYEIKADTQYADGGIMAKGGVVDYKKIIKHKEWGKSKGVWNAWTNSQRYHFITDHFVFEHGVRIFENNVPKLANMNWNEIVKSDEIDAIKIYNKLEHHIGIGQYKMGGVTFQDKVDSISTSLLKRKKVSPSVQKDYGKTYSKSESIESAKRIAGALRKKEKARKK